MRPTPLTDKFLSDLKINMKKNLKIKQTTLAHGIGTTKATVFRWFQGSRKPTGEFILKIQAWMKETIKVFL